MAQLALCFLLCLLVRTSFGSTFEDDGDMEVSESRLRFRNLYSGPILPPHYGYQSTDPLQESGSQPTQQYAVPLQSYLKYPQGGVPQVYQQSSLNFPMPYHNVPTPLQSPLLYGNSVQGSGYGSGYGNIPFINYTLLANVEILLKKIEPELAELNRTRAVKSKLYQDISLYFNFHSYFGMLKLRLSRWMFEYLLLLPSEVGA